MILELKVPSPGESITEVQIARWLKKDGDYVQKEEEVCEIDSDKATLTINSEQAGQIKILAKDGDTVKVGSVVAKIDTDAKAPAVVEKPATNGKAKEAAPVAAKASTPVKVAQEQTSYASGTPSPAAKKMMAESKNIGLLKIFLYQLMKYFNRERLIDEFGYGSGRLCSFLVIGV